MPWLRSLLKLPDTCIQSKHAVNIRVYVATYGSIFSPLVYSFVSLALYFSLSPSFFLFCLFALERLSNCLKNTGECYEFLLPTSGFQTKLIKVTNYKITSSSIHVPNPLTLVPLLLTSCHARREVFVPKLQYFLSSKYIFK